MSFVTELREELVAAAEREQARRLPRLQVPLRPALLTAAATAALALIIVVATGSLRTAPDEDRPTVTEPTPDARPLFGGQIESGVRYQTRDFVPALSFVPRDDEWRAVITDQPNLVLLERGEGFFDPGGERWPPGGLSFTYIREVYDPTLRGLQASRRPAPTDLHAWLSVHPDLRVGRARPVTVAGVPGERLSIEARFDRPTHPDPECRRRWQLTCTALAPGASLQSGTLIEMTILPIGPDPLIIVVDHHTRAGLREMQEAAAPVLESLRIGVR